MADEFGDFGDFGSFDIKGDDFADFADFESAPIALPLRTGSSVDCPDRFLVTAPWCGWVFCMQMRLTTWGVLPCNPAAYGRAIPVRTE